MKRILFLCSLSIFLIVLVSDFSAQTVSVPLSHWGYDAMERWEVRGFVDGVFNGTRPFTRLEMAEYLEAIWRSYQQAPERFSRTDVDQLFYLSVEFEEELPEYILSRFVDSFKTRIGRIMQRAPFRYLNKWFYKNRRNMVNFHHGDFNLYADPILATSFHQQANPQFKSFDRSRISNGFLFRGNLGNYLGFNFHLTDNHLRDDRWKNQRVPYEVLEESGYPFLLRRNHGPFDFDENASYLTFNYKYFYLLYGREYNQWGIGHNGNMLLSTNAVLYDQIKFVVKYWRFKYTHLSAFLEYISPEARVSVKNSPQIDAYWSGNRLELDLGRGLQLGFSEAIVYGNRSLDIGYLNPLSFFKSLEHYYGDRDNGVLGVDFEWRIINGMKVFGEWFIDDITTGKLGSNFFGNKFGLQGGVFLVNPFSIPDIDLLLEYTRIKPYVYSQSFRDYNKYKHYDTILGHYIGPNSDDLLIRLRKRLSRFLQLSLVYEKYRHGSNPENLNVGGDPDNAFSEGDSRSAPFLAGIRNEQTAWGVSVSYELIRDLKAEIHYRRFQYDTRDWENLIFWRISFNFAYREETFRNIFPLPY